MTRFFSYIRSLKLSPACLGLGSLSYEKSISFHSARGFLFLHSLPRYLSGQAWLVARFGHQVNLGGQMSNLPVLPDNYREAGPFYLGLRRLFDLKALLQLQTVWFAGGVTFWLIIFRRCAFLKNADSGHHMDTEIGKMPTCGKRSGTLCLTGDKCYILFWGDLKRLDVQTLSRLNLVWLRK